MLLYQPVFKVDRYYKESCEKGTEFCSFYETMMNFYIDVSQETGFAGMFDHYNLPRYCIRQIILFSNKYTTRLENKKFSA